MSYPQAKPSTAKAKKGQFIWSKNLDPQTDWKVHSVDGSGIIVKDNFRPQDKQRVLHGNYAILDNE